jgi:sugar/nucleoside kinase (ribokinase family)
LAEVFAGRDVDLAGLEIRPNSKTFRWTGAYKRDMDERTTEHIELNVLAEAPPTVPPAFADSKFVFLANTMPKLQHELLAQITEPVFVAADTMGCWIQDHLGDLKSLFKKIDCLIINEDEAKQLAGEHNLIKAAQVILGMGVSVVVIKKGESGSLMCIADGETFLLPAYPAEKVKDPTGAGDSFAGGFMGHLAQTGKTDFATLKTAIAYGTVTASFTIAEFSLRGLTETTKIEIDRRLENLRELTSF